MGLGKSFRDVAGINAGPRCAGGEVEVEHRRRRQLRLQLRRQHRLRLPHRELAEAAGVEDVLETSLIPRVKRAEILVPVLI